MNPAGSGLMGVGVLRTASPLARKLGQFVALTGADIEILEQLPAAVETFGADLDIMREGEISRSIVLILDGMAARYRVLPDGGRQILAFMIPGDLCDGHCLLQRRMDHAIGTMTATRIGVIARTQMAEMFANHPHLAVGLQWSALQEEAMMRERVVALGRRNARGRVAYLLCELLWRYEAVGMASGRTVCWPLTQTELGDALGLTAVYINRVLKDFRRDRLISITPGRLCVLDVAALQRHAGFSQEYLRLGDAAGPAVRKGERRETGDRPAAPHDGANPARLALS